MQDIRKFTQLAAGCDPVKYNYATVAPPAANMESYNEAVANSCTDTYVTGKVVAKADGIIFACTVCALVASGCPPVFVFCIGSRPGLCTGDFIQAQTVVGGPWAP